MSQHPKARSAEEQAQADFQEGCNDARFHVILSPVGGLCYIQRLTGSHNLVPREGWALVFHTGSIHAHPTRRAPSAEWTWVIAKNLLHLGFGHLDAKHQHRPDFEAWAVACDVVAARFLHELKLGKPPDDFPVAAVLEQVGGSIDEERLCERLRQQGIPPLWRQLSTAGAGALALKYTPNQTSTQDWPKLLAQGLRNAVSRAVDVAGGVDVTAYRPKPRIAKAREWFILRYPLLGALAAAFEVVDDTYICQRLQISVAAVDAEARTLYINSAANLTDDELRFVMAHELLHVGLRHQARRQGRDPYLWNVACDYVINDWLIEMEVGAMPDFGALHDPELRGLSAESVYDRIAQDLRRLRKLHTLRGHGLGDMMEDSVREWWRSGEGMRLDDFYRRCLVQGLSCYEDQQGRGYLPAGLIEEIRALYQPPIPWDVELARWFDHWFPPDEKRRSYARPSRRQSSTPDIPRPRYVPHEEQDKARTFGVILDTSGSMDTALLGKALGAIGSYAQAREVPLARVIFCDAQPYDQGYMPPEDILRSVKVKGRGGTVLQPAVDLLEKAPDFPPDGPILFITDGLTDVFRTHRPHAFLMPGAARLPFNPRGPVFRIE
jgi:predicted metal-dependent peptidase